MVASLRALDVRSRWSTSSSRRDQDCERCSDATGVEGLEACGVDGGVWPGDPPARNAVTTASASRRSFRDRQRFDNTISSLWAALALLRPIDTFQAPAPLRQRYRYRTAVSSG